LAHAHFTLAAIVALIALFHGSVDLHPRLIIHQPTWLTASPW
jgi:hypothetical protein